MELVGIEEASTKARDLLAFFREKQWPTFHIQHISTHKAATFFLPDTDGVKIHENIRPFPQEGLIQKHYPNSFRETKLAEKLTDADVNHVVICGAMSHMCIDATTRAAFDLGFTCVVIQDGCATRSLIFRGKTITAEDVHGAFMSALGSAYAQVLSLYEFLRNAKSLS